MEDPVVRRFRQEEKDCAPHPLDIMTIYALYQ